MKRLLSLTLFSSIATLSLAQERQNVLFILVDDMQQDALEKLSNSTAGSKVINDLIDKGTKFSNCYTMGAIGGALSMPSRVMIMTGRHVYEIPSDGSIIAPSQQTLPEVLREQGYKTFATGKWHSDYKSFNRSFATGDNIMFGGMHPYSTGGHTTPVLRHYCSEGKYKDMKTFTGDRFSSEMYADATIDFIDSRKDSLNPFFAYVAFTSPHDPHNKLPWYSKPIDKDKVVFPENYAPEHPFDNGELRVRDETVVPSPRTKETIIEQNSMYGGMINEVGIQIGRILEALDKTGQRDNTIIVFAGDNGLAMGQHGLMGKQNLYEHSISVPLAVIVPNQTPNVNEGLCYLADVNPTLYNLLGIEAPSSVTTEVLDINKRNTKRDAILLVYSSIQRAVVWKNKKMIVYNVDGKITKQLFDLEQDPYEMNNLALDKSNAKTVKKYEKKLSQLMKENNDFCDLSNPNWWSDGHKITWTEGINLIKY